MIFDNRTDAGKKLAKVVGEVGNFTGWIVVGLARGGVIIGAEIAKALSLPMASLYADDYHLDGHTKVFVTGLDCAVTWKTSADGMTVQRELVSPLDRLTGTNNAEASETVNRVTKMQTVYNAGAELVVKNERVILCDDGIVSGHSAISAIEALRHAGAKEIVLAIPVVPASLPEEVCGCKTVYYRRSRMSNFATGMFYFEFDDVPDQQVVDAVAA